MIFLKWTSKFHFLSRQGSYMSNVFEIFKRLIMHVYYMSQVKNVVIQCIHISQDNSLAQLIQLIRNILVV